MGLIGILLTSLLLVLGAGYYYFSMPQTPMSITNDVPVPVVSGIEAYQELQGQADEIKSTFAEKVQEATKTFEDAPIQETIQAVPVPTEPSGDTLEIVERLMTAGFTVPVKTRTIDTIVLHSSYNPNGGDAYSVSELVKIYESYGVSAHYLIDRNGKIYRLVADKNIAYHAGVSKMPDQRTNVNDFSLGIEMMNTEKSQFTSAQYRAVNSLVAYLKKTYGIKNIVGHSDIAPTRKTDPWNFDWKRLKN